MMGYTGSGKLSCKCPPAEVAVLKMGRFRTSGNVVVVLTALSVMAYVCLLVLTLQLDS